MSTNLNLAPSTQPPTSPPQPRPQPKPQSRARSLFWAGFALSFLLASVLSCGGLAMSMGLNNLNLASIGNQAPAWTPPPTPSAAEQVSASADNSNATGGSFAIGDQVRNITNSRVNIRQTPGHLGKTSGDILAQMESGDRLEIIGAPTQADNLVWWPIRFQAANGSVIEGWVAEATASGVQILGP